MKNLWQKFKDTFKPHSKPAIFSFLFIVVLSFVYSLFMIFRGVLLYNDMGGILFLPLTIFFASKYGFIYVYFLIFPSFIFSKLISGKTKYFSVNFEFGLTAFILIILTSIYGLVFKPLSQFSSDLENYLRENPITFFCLFLIIFIIYFIKYRQFQNKTNKPNRQ